MKKYILLFVIFLFSCSNKNIFRVNVSKIDIELPKIERFEDIYFNLTEDNIEEVKKKYNIFFNDNSNDKVWINKKNDSLQLILYKDVKKEFSDISWLEKELQDLFKHIKYYYSDFVIPKVYTYVDGSDYDLKNIYALDKNNNPFLAIPLDLYLGKNNFLYGMIEDYIKENMKKEMIVRNIAFTIAKNLYPNKNYYPQLIESMIYNGKLMYMVNSFIPEISQENLFGYSSQKVKWTNENERYMWIYFMKNNLLYSTSKDVYKRFIDIAPFSKFYLELDRDSPGQVGIWIGYNIVKNYIKNNSDNLENLLKKEDLSIFKQSFYKP